MATIKNILTGLRVWMLKHKFYSLIIAGVLIGGGFYFFGGTATVQTSYVLGIAQRGSIVVSVGGTGQVSATSQVDAKAKASGEVVYVGVVQGQQVKSGALIAKLDATDAEKQVRDAQASLDGAKISLEKLKQPADNLSKIQTENALISAKQNKQNTQDDLVKSYDDGLNSVANAFLDLPGVVSGIDSILNGNDVNPGQSNYSAYYDLSKAYKSDAREFMDSAVTSYSAARIAYDKNFADYKNSSRYSGTTETEALLAETYDTAKKVSEAIKDSKNFLDMVTDALSGTGSKITPPAILATHESKLQSYTGSINSNLNTLLNIITTIKNDKEAIISADRTIAEKTEALSKLLAGADPLDIQAQELSITQKENALLDAKQNLANYYVYAPFAGTVAKLNIIKGDSASAGTAVATIITAQKTAEISFNEVDIAKIKIGQKATLTFDAIPDLAMTGQVVQIDSIGTVSQGVVNYNVKVAMDTQDERIKSGMSVSASIILDTRINVLVVPGTAVKGQAGAKYVEVLEEKDITSVGSGSEAYYSVTAPTKKTVVIGESSDSETEIISGLSEGDKVITKTTTASQTTTQTSGSAVRIPGLGGGR